jgi:hypothetical protein
LQYFNRINKVHEVVFMRREGLAYPCLLLGLIIHCPYIVKNISGIGRYS